MQALPEQLDGLSSTKFAQLTNTREARAREILAKGDDNLSEAELDELTQINDDLERIRGENRGTQHPGFSTRGRSSGGEFSQAIIRAGWDPVSKSRVQLGVGSGLNLLQSVTWSGTTADIAAPVRISPSVLAADRRYIYPALKVVGMAPTDTSVDYIRQTSRSLAAPSDMVRALDAVIDKPESTFVAGLESATLAQVAHVIKGVPNIIARQRDFGQLIDNEMRLGISEALDYQVVTAINGASITMAGGATNRAEDIRKAMTIVEAAGYNPDTVALPPAFAEELDILSLTLLNSTGADGYFGLRARISKSLTAPIVFDSSAFGSLFLGPTEFMVFEENAGLTNTQLYRAEVNAVTIIDRSDAACIVYAS